MIEVRSPTDRWTEVLAKVREYLGIGVKVVMILDPAVLTAMLFRAEELPQTLDNGDILTIPDVLPHFSVPVRQFFE